MSRKTFLGAPRAQNNTLFARVLLRTLVNVVIATVVAVALLLLVALGWVHFTIGFENRFSFIFTSSIAAMFAVPLVFLAALAIEGPAFYKKAHRKLTGERI
jgi:hypothetical protein